MKKIFIIILLFPLLSLSQPITVQGEDYATATGDIHVVGSVLGYISTGELVTWDITATSGYYKFGFRVACPNTGEQARLLIDGTNVGTLTIPNTGSFSTFTTLYMDILIPTNGTHTFRWESLGPAYGPDIDYFTYEKYILPSVDIGPRTALVYGVRPGNFGHKVLHASVLLQPGRTVDTYAWSKISGVGGSIIGQGTADVDITGLSHGLHVYMIDVTDNVGDHAYDTVDITVRFCEGGTKHVILPYTDSADMYTTHSTFAYNPYAYPSHNEWLPGDTVAFSKDSVWGLFEMFGYKGTPGCDIVLTNSDTTIPTRFKRGIQLFSCEYIKVTGARKSTVLNTKPTDSEFYGLTFSNFGVLNERHIQINGRSKCITIEHIYSNGSYAIVEAKHDQPQDFEITGADTMYQYPNWKMDSIRIVHVRARNCFKDGIYAGNTDPLGQRLVLQGGILRTGVIPIRLANFSMQYCWLQNTGRTIAQLSGCETGIQDISYNWLEGGGYELNQQQGNGFSIGGMTRNARVHDNHIKNTWLFGIFDFGADSNQVYNNIVDSSGYIPLDTLAYFYPEWTNYDSLDAARSDFTIVGGWFKNNDAGGTYSMITSPDSTLPHYNKWLRLQNNQFGVNTRTDNYEVGFIPWRGHLEDWSTTNYVCGNVIKGTATQARMYRPAFGANPSWPLYLTDCSIFDPLPPPNDKQKSGKWKYKNKN